MKSYKKLSHRNEHICSLQKVDEDPKISEDLPPNAKWYMKLARCMRKIMLADPRISGTKQFIQSIGAIQHERRKQLFIKKWYIIHPFSMFIYCWRVFFTVYTGIILFYMPVLTYYPADTYSEDFPLKIYIAESVAVLDMLLKFITGYLHEDTKTIILEPRRIVYNYVKSGLFLELVATFPSNIFITNVIAQPEKCHLYLKSFRFFVFFNYFDIIIDQNKVSYSSGVILRLIVQSFYLLHWFCSIHYHFPKFMAHFKGYIDDRSWIVTTKIFRNTSVSFLEKYVTNLNEVLKFITGFRYTERIVVDEIIFLIISMLIGFIYLEYLFCTILGLENYLIAMHSSFVEKIRSLKKTMRNKHLPLYLREKVLSFVYHKFGGMYYSETMILDTLSSSLRQEIKLYLCESLLQRVKIFNGMPRNLLRRTTMNFQLETYMPGDVIVEAGSIGDSMYFISSGTVSVVSFSGREVTHLEDGAYFGETVLLFPNQPRLATVTSLEITEVYKLSEQDFAICIAGYPDFKQKLMKISKRRKKQLLDMDHDYIDKHIENFAEKPFSNDN